MVNEKYWIFGKYNITPYKKWKPLLDSYDLVCGKNKNIMLMLNSFIEYYTNNMGSEIPSIFKVINEYLTHKITLSKKINYKQYNYITNSEEFVLENDTIIIPNGQTDLDDELFNKIKHMLVLLSNYKPPKKKLSDKQIEEDIKLKLEPLFRKKKINKFLKDE